MLIGETGSASCWGECPTAESRNEIGVAGNILIEPVELSDADLDAVAGGSSLPGIFNFGSFNFNGSNNGNGNGSGNFGFLSFNGNGNGNFDGNTLVIAVDVHV
jgi:hypothetical protein